MLKEEQSVNWDSLILINLYILYSYVGDVTHSEEEDTQHLQRKHRKIQEQMFNYNVERQKNGF